MWGIGGLSQLCNMCMTQVSRGSVSSLSGDLAGGQVAGQQAGCQVCAQARLRCCKCPRMAYASPLYNQSALEESAAKHLSAQASAHLCENTEL